MDDLAANLGKLSFIKSRRGVSRHTAFWGQNMESIYPVGVQYCLLPCLILLST